MENKQPLLSICIPTYNREKYLKECLDSIVNQELFNENDIEIVISDNASEDGTKELVKLYQDKYKNIRYFRNEENLWFDRNLDNTLNNANWKFCWTLSDDEYLDKWNLVFILNIINKNTDAWVILIWNIDWSWNIIKLNNWNDFLYKYWIFTAWLVSNNIFNRKLIPKDRSIYFWNLWIHVSILFYILKNNYLVITNKSIFKKWDWICHWAKWWKAFYTFINLKNIILNNIDLWYDKEIINNYIKIFIKALPKTIISAKIQWLKCWYKELKILFKEFYKYPIILIISILIFVIPNKLFILTKNIVKWQ